MKPPLFDYYDPTTETETLALLAEFGPDAKLLAGGQSLMPLLNMRLVEPAALVDLNRVASLSYIRQAPEALYIGALTRQRQIERSPVVAHSCPLLCEALQHVGYVQIRHRGTLGGSLAHADPAAELPAVMMALEAQFMLRSQRGSGCLPRQNSLSPLSLRHWNQMSSCAKCTCPVAAPYGLELLEGARVAGAFAIVDVAAAMRRKQAVTRQQGRYLGIGMATFVEGGGLGPYEGVVVRVEPGSGFTRYPDWAPRPTFSIGF